MQTRIKKHFSKLALLPMSTEVGGLTLAGAFIRASGMIQKAKRVYIIGNGGSASIASHMAEDYTKNGGVRMIAFNDAPMLTCFANDYGYENVFSKAVESYADKGDLLIAISSSGRSANILNAVAQAKYMGCKVITFSGFNRQNPLRELGDVNFYVPDNSYGNVEIVHLALLHSILDFMVEDNK